jgi:23S rRNA pseudouridine2605 synthase
VGLESGPGLEAAQVAVEERARQAAQDAVALDIEAEDGGEIETGPGTREPARLERLQKILSQAGVASRRRAEEMIVAGRVMVNGQVVTQLGSKADPDRDHIRVDGKLLHGAERHRYFLLNKPKGYVTTVSDPEGRPTVMQFFGKMPERLYPVGRLDYQSEGLLLMTNDGELANLLTKAGSGVEKIYLVKVAGQLTEEQMVRLRGGVVIEKGSPGSSQTGPRLRDEERGSERVQTAPARVRQVRQGDNPWYEVVLTEGRNRELRKMFAAVGHFAEKIRRVGYGPLALDVEPGKMRELRPDEVNALRLTAEGRMKPRRINVDRLLPKEAGIPVERRAKFNQRRNEDAKPRLREREGGFGRTDQQERKQGRPGDRPHWQRGTHEGTKAWQPRGREYRERGERRPFGDGERRERGAVGFQGGNRPFGKGGRVNPGFKSEISAPRTTTGPRESRNWGSRDRGRREGQRPFGEKPRFERPGSGGGPRREGRKGGFDGERRKPFQPRRERPEFTRNERPNWKQSSPPKQRFDGGHGKGLNQGAQFGAKPGGPGRFRGEGGRGRKFGGSRPGAKPGGWKRG